MTDEELRARLDAVSTKDIADELLGGTDYLFDVKKSEQSFMGKYGLYVAIAAAIVLLIILYTYFKK